MLRQFLADRDVSCPVCRYNLRDLRSDHCPECGAQLDLRVGSADLKLGPWLASLLSVGLPLGFLFIMTALITVMDLMEGAIYPGELPILGTLIAGTIGYAMALTALIWKRTAFWRRSRVRQVCLAWLICGLAWLAAAAIIVVVFLLGV